MFKLASLVSSVAAAVVSLSVFTGMVSAFDNVASEALQTATIQAVAAAPRA